MPEFEMLNNSEIAPDLFSDVLIFSFAEGGAMGIPGEMMFITSSKKAFRLNYVYTDVDIQKVKECFPVLAKCNFGLFGRGSTVPEGWNYVNLGAGNHLVVSDVIYPEFEERIEDCDSPGKIYARWISIACKLIGINEEKEKQER